MYSLQVRSNLLHLGVDDGIVVLEGRGGKDRA